MSARAAWAVLACLAMVVAVVAVATLWVTEAEAPVLGASEPLPFTGAAGNLPVEGNLTLLPDGQLRVDVRFEGADDALPGILMTMPEHAMAPVVPAASPVAADRAVATTHLPMGGLWELRLDLPRGQVVVSFRIAD